MIHSRQNRRSRRRHWRWCLLEWVYWGRPKTTTITLLCQSGTPSRSGERNAVAWRGQNAYMVWRSEYALQWLGFYVRLLRIQDVIKTLLQAIMILVHVPCIAGRWCWWVEPPGALHSQAACKQHPNSNMYMYITSYIISQDHWKTIAFRITHWSCT